MYDAATLRLPRRWTWWWTLNGISASSAVRLCYLWMRPTKHGTGVLLGGLLLAAFSAFSQNPSSKEAESAVAQGTGARAAPTDYQAHAQAGTVTIAADYIGHFVPTAEKNLTTDDYVTVEAGLFGPAGARLTLSPGDFSLRINGKKTPLPSQPSTVVARTVSDPDWVPPGSEDEKKEKSKTGISNGTKQDEAPLSKPHPPPEMVHAMALQVQRAAIPQGDRVLPQAGLLYFEYRGKDKGVHSAELIYSGPAGQATLELQP